MINQGFKRIESAIHFVSALARRFASILLAFMILIMVVDVVGRYIFNHSIRGTIDIIEETLIFIVFFATGEVAAMNRHVKVDLAISIFSKKIQSKIFCFTNFVSLVMSALITWQLAMRGWSLIVRPTLSTTNLNWPLGPFYMVAAFGCLLLSFELIVIFIHSVKSILIKETKD